MTEMPEERNRTERSTLYLVATPIGNLADITERARKVLSEVDFIAAEDTRNTGKLLACLGIRQKLISYHEHNKKESGEKIVARLLAGESCAVVTDAGMPAISDPGEDIVRLCAGAGIPVSVIPGACAAVSALSVSGLATGRFAFEGFLSPVKGERKKRLDAVQNEMRTMIFYEAPHKLCRTLCDLADTFGTERRIALCRELTKKNEEILRMTIGGAIAYYGEHEPRGEYVLIVEGGEEAGISQAPIREEAEEISPAERVRRHEEEGLSRMDAIKAAAREIGMTKSELYAMLNKD